MTSSAATPVPPPPAGAAPAGRARVLVTDDSRVIRQAIKKILDSEFEVELAESGDAAWARLMRGETFQMIVTDIEMPGIDGYELICRIRGSEEAPFRDIPILTITGAEDEETKQRAFACGATDFITKPIDAIQLRARAQSYVRLEQTARDLTEKASQLEDQAVDDPVTGLHSRRYFMQRGEQDLAFCVRNHKDLTVIRLDIDHYKDVYRKYGDEVNDLILKWLADLVAANARVEDTVARVAGAKFAVLATATDIEAARMLCQRVRSAIQAKPFKHGNDVVKITLSLGMASLVQDRAARIEDLLDLAEQRVGRAAIEGGDRICVSVLGETTPTTIEEVVIDVPPPAEPVAEAVTPPAAPKAAEAVKLGVATTPSPAVGDTTVHLISIDKALQLLASGQGKMIEPYLKALTDQLRPLLDLIARDERK